MDFKAIMGPFDHCHFELHFSPYMRKSETAHRHTITDLSWPRGDSVNDGIAKKQLLGTEFQQDALRESKMLDSM